MGWGCVRVCFVFCLFICLFVCFRLHSMVRSNVETFRYWFGIIWCIGVLVSGTGFEIPRYAGMRFFQLKQCINSVPEHYLYRC